MGGLDVNTARLSQYKQIRDVLVKGNAMSLFRSHFKALPEGLFLHMVMKTLAANHPTEVAPFLLSVLPDDDTTGGQAAPQAGCSKSISTLVGKQQRCAVVLHRLNLVAQLETSNSVDAGGNLLARLKAGDLDERVAQDYLVKKADGTSTWPGTLKVIKNVKAKPFWTWFMDGGDTEVPEPDEEADADLKTQPRGGGSSTGGGGSRSSISTGGGSGSTEDTGLGPSGIDPDADDDDDEHETAVVDPRTKLAMDFCDRWQEMHAGPKFDSCSAGPDDGTWDKIAAAMEDCRQFLKNMTVQNRTISHFFDMLR